MKKFLTFLTAFTLTYSTPIYESNHLPELNHLPKFNSLPEFNPLETIVLQAEPLLSETIKTVLSYVQQEPPIEKIVIDEPLFIIHKYPEYTKIDYNNWKVKQKLRQGAVTLEFLAETEKVCQNLDMHCMALLSTMDQETGGTFSPKRQNWNKKKKKGTKAIGLIQFMPDTAKKLGTSTKKLRRMSQIKQLKYVELYFRRMDNSLNIDYSQPENVVLAVFYPKAIGKSPRYVILDQDEKPIGYNQNKNGDRDNDGKIRVKEVLYNKLNRGYLKEGYTY